MGIRVDPAEHFRSSAGALLMAERKAKRSMPPANPEGNTHTNAEPLIAHSALSVTLGERLRRAAPMKKIKKDK